MSSQRNKIKKLDAIKKEVEEFHPLIEEIFKAMDEVAKVTYTHGVNEKGADFILEKSHSLLSTTEYIGLIVKVGKISNSFGKICEQIEDCDLERYHQDGKKKIRLDEIWIVTNKTISENSKQKIWEKFKTRKIQFVSRGTIIDLIDKCIPNYWSSLPYNLSKYLNRLEKEMVGQDSSFSLVSDYSNGYYVNLDLKKKEYKFRKEVESKQKKTSLSKEIGKRDFIVIEGGAGSGKSQLVRNEVKLMCNSDRFFDINYLPVFTTYQDFIKIYKSTLDKLIHEKMGVMYHELGDKFYSKLEVVVFIDGFDEVIGTEREFKEELKDIIKDSSFSYKLKVVLTTRPIESINYNDVCRNNPVYEILPLDSGKMYTLLQNVCSKVNVSGKIFEDLKKSELFKQLPRNPISVILLANLLDENSYEIPSSLTDTYQKYIEIMLGRWDKKKGLGDFSKFEASCSILSEISYYMLNNNITFISKDEARKMFYSYLDERNMDIEAEVLFDAVNSRSGIFQKSPDGATVFFKHRSFAEFFYALKKYNSYDPKFIDRKVTNPSWKNVYFFYVGLHKDCEEILDKIYNVEAKESEDILVKVVSFAEYFLAGYATPYRVVTKYMPSLIKSYADIYQGIVKGEINSDLDTLPEVTLLIFFQSLIASAYSYEFFLDSLENAILEIMSDETISDEKKGYSLFFISVIFRSLNKENPFVGIVDSLKGKLPVQIELGIFYESKFMKEQTTYIRRIEKKLRKKMKKGNDAYYYVNKLLTVPLKDRKER